ncbi:MAG: propanediol utilization protein [Pseudotabrizicola sp.]|uniref:propanediol utilization protein n=1 Tax=Pseudotabrizicola sp. TaxID=2939647 RepID=UPI002725850D|nr:propanediol utilization protein [Pseudotabrizicola sp.]MDO8882565.1 propanediol utilization protein [Pseudotabrizicola sp.]MDP2081160.1 propanediol utilization protein [Pseudotabrizicola sp.]MDZ7573112.1 propanediol utilization protein [Pseudotabrizicola sp.]
MTATRARQPKCAILRQPCHFGEWLQGRIGPLGPVALVTLLPDRLNLTAKVRPSARLLVKTLGTLPTFPVSSLRLMRFLQTLNLPVRGAYEISLAFPPGLGTGASTATLIAIARLAGFCGSPAQLARACIATEGASDPLMYPVSDRLLWASRNGTVLRRLPPAPRAHLLTGFVGPALPTDPADQDYDDISDLVVAWSEAKSLPDFVALSQESARRCLARRGPTDDPTDAVARELGALGWATSHSGAARALIFAPGSLPIHGAAALCEAGFYGVQEQSTGGDTGPAHGWIR